jgi:hypothetical protein
MPPDTHKVHLLGLLHHRSKRHQAALSAFPIPEIKPTPLDEAAADKAALPRVAHLLGKIESALEFANQSPGSTLAEYRHGAARHAEVTAPGGVRGL